MGLTHNFLHKSYSLPPLPLCWISTDLICRTIHLMLLVVSIYAFEKDTIHFKSTQINLFTILTIWNIRWIKKPHFINSTYLQHIKHEQTKPKTSHFQQWLFALILQAICKYTSQWYLAWHILFAFSHSLKKSSRDKSGVRWLSVLEILPISLWRFWNQRFSVLKASIVSSAVLIHLTVTHMPNHCSCTSQFFVSFQDGRTRNVDAIPDDFCKSIHFFSLSCSNKNFPVCIRTKTTGSRFSISGLLQPGTNFRNSHNELWVKILENTNSQPVTQASTYSESSCT